jgi:hypothetical protein
VTVDSPPPENGNVRRQLRVVGAIALGVVLVLVALVVVFSGTFADRGRFATTPDPCGLVDSATVARFLPDARPSHDPHGGGMLDAANSASCDVRATPVVPAETDFLDLSLTVGRYTGGGVSGAPGVASKGMAADSVGSDQRPAAPVGGLGDEARSCWHTCMVGQADYWVRVSNLVIKVQLWQIVGTAPAGDTLKRDSLAVTRAALGRLAGPLPAGAVTASPAGAPPTTGTEPVDLCALVGPAFTAEVVPGASPSPSASPNASPTARPGSYLSCRLDSPPDALPGGSLELGLTRYGSGTAARKQLDTLSCSPWRQPPSDTDADHYRFHGSAGIGDASCASVTAGDLPGVVEIDLAVQRGGDYLTVDLLRDQHPHPVDGATELDLAKDVAGHVLDQLR